MQAKLRPAEIVPPPRNENGPEVLTVGEALVAFIAADGLPLRAATSFRRSVVGAEFNVAAGLARLGHRVQFAGRVGDDPLGQVVEDACRTSGFDHHLTRDTSAFTGVLVRDVQTARPTTVGYARAGSAGNHLCVDDLTTSAVRDVRALHTTGITAVLSPSSLEAVRWTLSTAQSSGAMVSFDPNLRWRLMHRERSRPVLASLLSDVDLLISGADELTWLAGYERVEEATAWALDAGPRLVIVKQGANGASVSGPAETMRVPAVPVTVLDPVGAGDAFVAGFLSGLLSGRSVERAVAEAHCVAALVVTTPGDTEGLPDAALRDSFSGEKGTVDR